MTCPRCGAQTPEAARFCPSCGLELAASVMREERKLVTTLFVDQVGSTAWADGADPEDVRDRNRVYYEMTRRIIEEFGGTLEKYAGDAVMAVFGVPLARSDDAERAIRAAIGILSRVEEINRQQPDLELAVRAGIATGEAVVAVNAPPSDALATGDIVNTAARLETAAKPGEIVVGAETRRLTEHVFHFESLHLIVAKGKRDPLEASRVTGIRAVEDSVQRTRAPFAGREADIALLEALWARATANRQPQLVSVLGPAGIGKSRLVSEFAEGLRDRGGRVLWGRSLAFEQQSPFHAAGQMVRRVAGVFENDPAETVREKIETVIESLFGAGQESIDLTRFLSLMLGLGIDKPASELLHIHFSMRRLIEKLAEATPLLLVFDDVHWADNGLLDLIAYLSRHLQDHPIVMVGTARPEFLDEHPSWAAGLAAHTSIVLDPLSADASAAIVEALMSQSRESADRIVGAAGGNPLFLEELVASISDVDADQLPTSVRAVLTSRIDALPPNARRVILSASVIGKSFWEQILSRASGISEVREALDELETRGLVQRRPASTVIGDTEFSFKHDLIRDAAYAILPRMEKREMHKSVAETLESSVREPEEIAWLLARHWQAGGDAEKAIRYLTVAADRARDALAGVEAHDLLTQAVGLARSDEERSSLLLKRAVTLVELEEFSAAISELDAVLPSLRGRQEIEALLAYARSSYWTERTEQALDSAQRAYELATAAGFSELAAVGKGFSGSAHSMRGDPGDLERAVELCEQALGEWKPGYRPIDRGEVLHNVAVYHYWIGDHGAARRRADDARHAAGENPGSREALLRGAGIASMVLASAGRYEEAIASADEAIELAVKMGRPTNVMLNYSTLPLREIYANEDALAKSELVVSRLGPSEFNMPRMNGRCDLLSTLLSTDDLGRVDKDWPDLWDEAQGSRAWTRWHISGRAAWVRAELDLRRGRLDDAVTWGRRALDLAASVGRPKYETLSRIALGRALVRDGRRDAASEVLRDAIGAADRLEYPMLRWQSRAALAEAGTSEAEALRNDAAQIIRDIARNLTRSRSATFLAAPPVAAVLEGV